MCIKQRSKHNFGKLLKVRVVEGVYKVKRKWLAKVKRPQATN